MSSTLVGSDSEGLDWKFFQTKTVMLIERTAMKRHWADETDEEGRKKGEM